MENEIPFFRNKEKERLIPWKARTTSLSDQARAPGDYRKTKYQFCLPENCADQNLFPGIRNSAKEYFSRNEIKWHDGQKGNPSTHLCDSMVACVNFLFPFHNQPIALAALLRPFFPEIQEMKKLEDEQYVAFEWIGKHNYLNEKKSANRERTRGALFTSADAAITFKRLDGLVQIVLIEWKYTEAYFSTFIKYARDSGTDRAKIYECLYLAHDCPISRDVLPNYDSLFYEPFYQLMRQQLLANEMEKAHELGADIVSLLHISPEHNRDFLRVTSPDLKSLGNSATEVWKRLVKKPDRFTFESSENIFGNFPVERFPELTEWWH